MLAASMTACSVPCRRVQRFSVGILEFCIFTPIPSLRHHAHRAPSTLPSGLELIRKSPEIQRSALQAVCQYDLLSLLSKWHDARPFDVTPLSADEFVRCGLSQPCCTFASSVLLYLSTTPCMRLCSLQH